jgi:hypothetical protein
MKIKITERFGIIPNNILNDSNLSWKAKGIWGYIQSKPDDWDFSSERMSNDSLDGKDGTSSGLKELVVAGYLKRIKSKKDNGQWEWEYELSSKRIKNKPEADLPSTENPSTVFPSLEKPAINKERDTKKDNIYCEAGASPSKSSKIKEKKPQKEIVKFTPEMAEEELSKMELKENSHLDIIASFIREKKIKIENSKQLGIIIKRHCKSASELSGAYSNKQIFKVMEELQKDFEKETERGKAGNPIDWTLETVIKKLSK